MIATYIKQYLRLGMGSLSILELNDLQKEINEMIHARCDMLLAYESAIEDRVRAKAELYDPRNRLVLEGELIDRELSMGGDR